MKQEIMQTNENSIADQVCSTLHLMYNFSRLMCIYIFPIVTVCLLNSQQRQSSTRQEVVVDTNTQTDEHEQITSNTEKVESVKENTVDNKKKSLKDTMKEKAKKLKKFIGTKSSHKKQKDVRM